MAQVVSSAGMPVNVPARSVSLAVIPLPTSMVMMYLPVISGMNVVTSAAASAHAAADPAGTLVNVQA